MASIDKSCGCGTGKSALRSRGAGGAAGAASDSPTLSHTFAFESGLPPLPAHMVERTVAEQLTVRPSAGNAPAFNAIFTEFARLEALKGAERDHSDPGMTIPFANGLPALLMHVVEPGEPETTIFAASAGMGQAFDAIFAESARLDALQRAESDYPGQRNSALIDDRTTSPEFQRPPMEPPPPERTCRCDLECAIPDFQRGAGAKRSTTDQCETGEGGLLHGTLYLSNGPYELTSFTIWAEKPNGEQTKGLEFAKGHLTEERFRRHLGWVRPLRDQATCPDAYEFSIVAGKAGSYVVWAQWGDIEPCKMLIEVVKCECAELLCYYTGKKLNDPTVTAPNQKCARNLLYDLDEDPYRGKSANEIVSLTNGHQFVVITKGYDYVQHKVRFELKPAVGTAKLVASLTRGAPIPGGTTQPELLEDDLPCHSPAWCTFSLEEEDGKILQGEAWLIAKFDGKECGRKLIRVFNAKTCSLAETEFSAQASQAKALSARGGIAVTLETPSIVSVATVADYNAQVNSVPAGETVLNEIRMASSRALVSVSCSAIVGTDFKFDAEDCCCIFAKKVTIALGFRIVYQGLKGNPYESLLRQLDTWKTAEGTKADIAAAVLGEFPKCDRKKEAACKAWELTPDEKQTASESICRGVIASLVKLVGPVPAIDGDGEPADSTDEPGFPDWGDVPDGAMEEQCEGEAFLDVKTLRIKVHLGSNLSGPQRDLRKRLIVAALQGANAIFMQCCIRIAPEDMLVSAIKDIQNWDPLIEFGGVRDQLEFDYRTNLVVLDNIDFTDAGLRTWVGDKKSEDGGLGWSKCPRATQQGAFYEYGMRAAVWALIPRLICHEIGHNAGLACPEASSDHNDYNSGIYVMGSGNPAPPESTSNPDTGLSWKPYDCVVLRDFVINDRSPVWTPVYIP